MADKKFDTRTQWYLRSLPAVDMVTDTRIYYTSEFRRDAMRQYGAGGSPAQIFRDAGLDPKIIGYKRIERAIARWKSGAKEAPLTDPRDKVIAKMALRISELEHRVNEIERANGAAEEATAGAGDAAAGESGESAPDTQPQGR